jgi:hypothetical protein
MAIYSGLANIFYVFSHRVASSGIMSNKLLTDLINTNIYLYLHTNLSVSFLKDRPQGLLTILRNAFVAEDDALRIKYLLIGCNKGLLNLIISLPKE